MIEVERCAVCGAADLEPYASDPQTPEVLHYAQGRCQACGLLISQPQASPSDIDRYYRETYYARHWPDAAKHAAENEAIYARHEWPLMQRLWTRWPPQKGGSVVEVGCGYGALLPLLAREGYAVAGCDPSADAVAFCRSRGFAVEQGGVPGGPFRQRFDTAIAQHVIEHVPDPRAFVRGLVAMTMPGGRVVIVTEDAWNTQHGWERCLARMSRRVPRFRTSTDHTFVFSAAHLDRLLRDAGCEEVATSSFSYAPPQESLHWKAYKGAFRTLDRLIGRGDYLMAIGRVSG